MKELQEYRQRLLDIVEGRDSRDEESNKDHAHNALVESVFLEKCDRVDMFCGEMSIFRTELYDNIEQLSKAQNPVEERTYIEKQMRSQLKRFLEKEGNLLRVFVENYSPKLFEDLKWPDLFKQGLENKRIKIFSVGGERSLRRKVRHIAVGDYVQEGKPRTMVRLETDKELHTAQCRLRALPVIAQMSHEVIDNIQEVSTEKDCASLIPDSLPTPGDNPCPYGEMPPVPLS